MSFENHAEDAARVASRDFLCTNRFRVKRCTLTRPQRGQRAVFEIRSHAGDSLAAKVYDRDGAAAVHFRAMQELNRKTGIVARPLSLREDLNTVLIAWCRGTQLSEVLRGPDRSDVLIQFGTWLGELNHRAHEETRPLAANHLLSDILESAAHPALRPHRKDVRRATGYLLDQAQEVNRRLCAYGLTHTDLKPQNVILSADGIRAIDRPDMTRGYLLQNVAHALYAIYLERAIAAKTQSPWSGSAREDRIALLTGYGDHDPIVLDFHLRIRAIARWMMNHTTTDRPADITPHHAVLTDVAFRPVSRVQRLRRRIKALRGGGTANTA